MSALSLALLPASNQQAGLDFFKTYNAEGATSRFLEAGIASKEIDCYHCPLSEANTLGKCLIDLMKSIKQPSGRTTIWNFIG